MQKTILFGICSKNMTSKSNKGFLEGNILKLHQLGELFHLFIVRNYQKYCTIDLLLGYGTRFYDLKPIFRGGDLPHN